MALAESGPRVLAVSTDPAHSSAMPSGSPWAHGRGLSAVRRGACARSSSTRTPRSARWLGERRERLATIVLRGTYLDREDVERFLSLSLPGTDELIGLLELLASPG